MNKPTKRKSQSQSIFNKFWNEFLFARDFEYETPLTPDEMADALQKIESQETRSRLLSMRPLIHKVSIDREGDKANTFNIELESKDRGKWWETDSAMQVTEGNMTANPDTGMTVIKGRTKFTGGYYAVIGAMFMLNLSIQILDGDRFFQAIWIGVLVLFWYSMYRERNRFAKRVDDIIMNAKANASSANLQDTDVAFNHVEDNQAQQQLSK